jgi:hypothetical protein
MTKAANLAALGTSNGNSVLVSGTAVASTSGTSIDFTGIPSWVKRITVMLNSVSLSGTSNIRLQVGAGSITTTGYNGGTGITTSAGGAGGFNYSSGFDTDNFTASAADIRQGQMVLALIGSNTWSLIGTISCPAATGRYPYMSGTIALSGTLDRVRITTVNGTDTFDAGSINIMYE